MERHKEGPAAWPPDLLALVLGKDNMALDLMQLPSSAAGAEAEA